MNVFICWSFDLSSCFLLMLMFHVSCMLLPSIIGGSSPSSFKILKTAVFFLCKKIYSVLGSHLIVDVPDDWVTNDANICSPSNFQWVLHLLGKKCLLLYNLLLLILIWNHTTEFYLQLTTEKLMLLLKMPFLFA